MTGKVANLLAHVCAADYKLLLARSCYVFDLRLHPWDNIDTGKTSRYFQQQGEFFMRLYYRAKPNGQSYPANSEPPFHKVTHRHDKSIPGCTMLPPSERYAGVFPSADACAFVNSMKAKMKFFDDGERMRYNAPSVFIEVTPSDVDHPITYPPVGFVLEDGQWVFKGI